MQAVFYEPRKNIPLESSEPSISQNSSKFITRKPNGNEAMFKKKEGSGGGLTIRRDKRCRSSQAPKMLKKQSQNKDLRGNIDECEDKEGQVLRQTSPAATESLKSSSQSQSQQSSLLFNKFSQEQKHKVHQILQLLQTPSLKQKLLDTLPLLIPKIQLYIEQLESNNTKLLQINYFFQKQFGNMMAQRQLKKREKCSKEYCLECRYHLQKENRWKQEWQRLNDQIQILQEELKLAKGNAPTESDTKISIMVQNSPFQSRQKQSHNYQEELQKKDEQYIVLLKQYNYLNTLSKDTKNRLSNLTQEYKYLSIENRTLLGVRQKLVEKQMECNKFKAERDMFKKKVIQFHRKEQDMSSDSQSDFGKKQQSPSKLGEESVFSLSSVSTDRSPSAIQTDP